MVTSSTISVVAVILTVAFAIVGAFLVAYQIAKD